MATSSSRGNREVPKVEQIGKGLSERQLGLPAGGRAGRREKGGYVYRVGAGAAESDSKWVGAVFPVRWSYTCWACDMRPSPFGPVSRCVCLEQPLASNWPGLGGLSPLWVPASSRWLRQFREEFKLYTVEATVFFYKICRVLKIFF